MWSKINSYFKLPIISLITVMLFFVFMLEWRNLAYIVGVWVALWVYGIVVLQAMGLDLDKIE
ncbi:MAG TPA: hypothetical protein VIK78_19725 [Ruminiclostridium sp.]